MVDQIPLTTIVRFTDDNGYLTNEGRTIINALINRTGGATGGTVLFAGSEVYGGVTGSVLRAPPLVTNPVLAVGAVYSQAELTAIRNYMLALAEFVGALILDNQSVGVIQ